MIELQPATGSTRPSVLAIGLRSADAGVASVDPVLIADDALHAEVTRYVAEVQHTGDAGVIHVLTRPTLRPAAVILVGTGSGDVPGWRAAAAAIVRTASNRWPSVHLVVPPDAESSVLQAIGESAALASYRFRVGSDRPGSTTKLRRLLIDAGPDNGRVTTVLARATALTRAVALARDLTNAPSAQKSPRWFSDRVAAAAVRCAGVNLRILEPADLRDGGFGGILAVGGGSHRPPRLVELSWRPPVRRNRPRPRHVVLAGKGILFDTGGISMKPLDGMALMRKDMAGAAAVCATVLAAAELEIPVRVTAVVPLAENLVSGSAYRPGDVVRHYGGITTEVQNTDAEGRVVLADTLAYAARRLAPDFIVDLATLTGASRVALGRRTAALYTQNDELAGQLVTAGDDVGERMWRMPLAEDYKGALASDVADLTNSPVGGAGSITAALYLREFTGGLRDQWAHIDMSAPSWSESNDGLLSKGATGWGVRALIRWLESL